MESELGFGAEMGFGDLCEDKCFGVRYQNQSPRTFCFMKTKAGTSGPGSANGSPKSSPVSRELDWSCIPGQEQGAHLFWEAAGKARCSLAFWKKVLLSIVFLGRRFVFIFSSSSEGLLEFL